MNTKTLARVAIWAIVITAPSLIWYFFVASPTKDATHPAPQSEAAPVTVVPDIARPPIDTSAPVIRQGGRTLLPVARPPLPDHPLLRVTVVQIDGAQPIGLMVTDSKGLSTGEEGLTGKHHRALTNAQLTLTKNKRGQRVYQLLAEPATDTRYVIAVASKAVARYRIQIRGVSTHRRAGSIITEGKTIKQTIMFYHVDLDQLRAGMDLTRALLAKHEARVVVEKADTLDDICRYAYQQMSDEKAFTTRRENKWTEAGKPKTGCRITLTGSANSADGLSPHFLYPQEGSRMYLKGWKVTMVADGPDGADYHINNGTVACDVSGSWDGGDDSDPNYKPSDRFELWVTCRKLATR